MSNIVKREQMKKIAMTVLAIGSAIESCESVQHLSGFARIVTIQQIAELNKQKLENAYAIPASVYYTDKPQIDIRRYTRYMRKV